MLQLRSSPRVEELAQRKAYNSQEAPGGRVGRQRRNYTSREGNVIGAWQ